MKKVFIVLFCALAIALLRAGCMKLSRTARARADLDILTHAMVDGCLEEQDDGSTVFADKDVFLSLPKDIITCRLCGEVYQYSPVNAQGQRIKHSLTGREWYYVVKHACISPDGKAYYILNDFYIGELSDAEVDSDSQRVTFSEGTVDLPPGRR